MSQDANRDPGACCPVDFLDQVFNEGYARRELSGYRKDGLGERARVLVDQLVSAGIEGRSVLEIGAGIGALNLELLEHGASHAVSVDAAASNVRAAAELAVDMGLSDRIERRVGDFVDIQDEFEPADVVLLDRVICCYRDMQALLGAAGAHTSRYCGLAYPRHTWWGRAAFRLINLFQTVRRRPFRVHMHHPAAIERVLTGAGLRRTFKSHAGFWEVVLFERPPDGSP